MVPEAGTGHWEHSPACLATSAASCAVPITLCHPHHISPAPPACQGPEQSHQLLPHCQPSPPGLPEPALQPPSLKPERALCVLQAPGRMEAAGLCRGALQHKEQQFRDVGFNGWRLPSHALQHPCKAGLLWLLSQGAWGLRKAHSGFSLHTRGLR